MRRLLFCYIGRKILVFIIDATDANIWYFNWLESTISHLVSIHHIITNHVRPSPSRVGRYTNDNAILKLRLEKAGQEILLPQVPPSKC
jgi:hypothetical protein